VPEAKQKPCIIKSLEFASVEKQDWENSQAGFLDFFQQCNPRISTTAVQMR
jgi:hypothetical protein